MILDVGCGGDPRGDVNCDLLIRDSHEKWDQDPSWIKNFVKADARALPFRSGCFDVVYCSHMLEHLEDPRSGLKELLRVANYKVIVVLPFALFSLFDILAQGRNFGEHIRWLRKHHKHFFLMDPLKTGSFKLRFLNLRAALFERRKVYAGLLRIPIPFETLTEFIKSDQC